MSERSHLNHWEEVSDKHTAALEFIDWLQSEYGVSLDFDCARKGTPLDLRRLADEHFEVDRVGLERERRELLKQARRLSEDRRE